MKSIIIIPARYASSRLPGKPLADILGKPMIQHVYDKALQVPEASEVFVATDDQRIFDAVVAFGGRVLMTSVDHPSGTDRLVEVMQQVPADIYLNVQGDEPLIRPSDLSLLLREMQRDESAQVGTLCHTIDADEAEDPNSVKVIRDHNNNAIYFSRSLIPYPRNKEFARYFKHVGTYAYRRDVLASYADLPDSQLEQSESLEQLRLLSAGVSIRVLEVEPTGPGVDTPKCLERVRAIMAGKTFVERPTLADVRLVITDVDGVLTDGGIYYNETGECLKTFHVRDGLGIKLLQENGVQVAVLSGRDSLTLRKRLADLGVSIFRLGVKDKFKECQNIMNEADCTKQQTLYIGDDSIDIPAFAACGLSYTVADAADYIKKKVDDVLSLPGGKGAFRELADKILIAQSKESVLNTVEGYGQVMDKMVQ